MRKVQPGDKIEITRLKVNGQCALKLGGIYTIKAVRYDGENTCKVIIAENLHLSIYLGGPYYGFKFVNREKNICYYPKNQPGERA